MPSAGFIRSDSGLLANWRKGHEGTYALQQISVDVGS
jgi:hypothetical protein